MKRSVAFIPELKLDRGLSRRVKLTSNLYLLSENDKLAVDLRESITAQGYEISGGSYLYFEGGLRADGTLYEIFQGYCLALTFFYPKGRATCRVVKNLSPEESVELFIDEYDKFGYEKSDLIFLESSKIKKVEPVYLRVESQLENKDFNPLKNSLEFFILFLSEKQIRTRLLYLSICLESILLESEIEGISYKLGIRCANLLNIFYKNVDMRSTFEEVRNGYSLRSKIIHGSDYNKESTKIIKKKGGNASELSHVLNLETIVKDILSVIFLHQDLYDYSCKGQLGQIIDEKYILDCRL